MIFLETILLTWSEVSSMKNILVVDDEPILRMLIVDTLEDIDGDVDEADCGPEALRMLETKSYDLMIVDYMMPEMTGIEMLNTIDSTIKDKMQIIMLTAKTQEKDRVAAERSGVNLFMKKPFSPMELYTIVQEQLYANQ